jgi:YegS/Rv2252/BmrU family lipid kinase
MKYPEKHIAIICNPTRENQKSLRIADNISVLLSGIDIRHSVFTTYWPQVWDGISEVWIVGGDGTANFFVNHYPGIQLPLSIFPGGSGNDFHFMLYGDISIEDQVELILDSSPQFVDAGVCNGKLFLNGVGIGFDGAIVKDLLGKKKLSGKASYLLSILKNILSFHEKRCDIDMGEEKISQDCFMISVANGKRYGGGFNVTPKASVNDGLLDINIVGSISPLKRMKYLPVIEKGEHTHLDFIKYRQVKTIHINSVNKIPAHLDGEFLHEAVYDIEILPNRFSFLR